MVYVIGNLQIYGKLGDENREIVHRGMGHTASTASRYYRDCQGTKDHIEAYKLIATANRQELNEEALGEVASLLVLCFLFVLCCLYVCIAKYCI